MEVKASQRRINPSSLAFLMGGANLSKTCSEGLRKRAVNRQVEKPNDLVG